MDQVGGDLRGRILDQVGGDLRGSSGPGRRRSEGKCTCCV